jgi:hypothetical protein
MFVTGVNIFIIEFSVPNKLRDMHDFWSMFNEVSQNLYWISISELSKPVDFSIIPIPKFLCKNDSIAKRELSATYFDPIIFCIELFEIVLF